jgi:hypothetical protein
VNIRTPTVAAIIIAMALLSGGPCAVSAEQATSAAKAAGATRESEIQVSLITILPGKALYSAFGHSAIRVMDPRSGADVLFNYGFATKPFDLLFALNMLAGKMEFMAAVVDTQDSIVFYSQEENRTIIEQRLALDDAQKASMLSTLSMNVRPENRNYNYRYFSDNCATRPWKIIYSTAASATASAQSLPRPTLRESIARVLAKRPWIGFAIDLMLGPGADAPVRASAPIFLPGELMDWTAGLPRAGTNGGDKLVESTEILYTAHPERGPGIDIPPLAVAVALLAIALALSLFLRASHPAAISFDAILFGAGAIVCLAIGLFWLSAGYGEVAWNLNLLWALPLPLIALVWGRGGRRDSRVATILFRIAAVAAGLVALLGGVGIQSIAPAMRLIALAISLRCLSRGIGTGRAIVQEKRG